MNQENKKNSHKPHTRSSWLIPILYPIALIILFFEWGWEPLARFIENFAKLPFIAKLELRLLRLPPSVVMSIFLIPVIALLPFKFFALYLFGKGHVFFGTLLLISAKVAGTAFCASLFQITKPKLLQIKWFAYIYPKWKNWKDGLILKFKNSGVWRFSSFLKSRVKYLVHKLNRY